MKKYLLIALMAVGLSAAAQQTPTNKKRSNSDFSQVDDYIIGLKRLGIPTSDVDTLDAEGLPQNTAKLIYNSTLGKLRVYVNGEWSDASSADLSALYTKPQIDSLIQLKASTVGGNSLDGEQVVNNGSLKVSAGEGDNREFSQIGWNTISVNGSLNGPSKHISNITADLIGFNELTGNNVKSVVIEPIYNASNYYLSLPASQGVTYQYDTLATLRNLRTNVAPTPGLQQVLNAGYSASSPNLQSGVSFDFTSDDNPLFSTYLTNVNGDKTTFVTQTNENIAFGSGSNNMLIKSNATLFNGKVGIGRPNPSSELDIEGSASGWAFNLKDMYGSDQGGLQGGSYTGETFVTLTSSGSIQFNTAGAYAGKFDTYGSLSIRGNVQSQGVVTKQRVLSAADGTVTYDVPTLNDYAVLVEDIPAATDVIVALPSNTPVGQVYIITNTKTNTAGSSGRILLVCSGFNNNESLTEKYINGGGSVMVQSAGGNKYYILMDNSN